MKESYDFYDQDIITGYNGEQIIDKYKIFDGIKSKKHKNMLMYDLYYELGYFSLNYLLGAIDVEYNLCNDIDKLGNDIKKSIKLTLDYIYPLLKEGKLKVRILDYEKISDNKYEVIGKKEYSKDDAKKVIDNIKEKYLSINNIDERSIFSMYYVQFTLPENNWTD